VPGRDEKGDASEAIVIESPCEGQEDFAQRGVDNAHRKPEPLEGIRTTQPVQVERPHAAIGDGLAPELQVLVERQSSGYDRDNGDGARALGISRMHGTGARRSYQYGQERPPRAAAI
jgi:hypothetical protein